MRQLSHLIAAGVAVALVAIPAEAQTDDVVVVAKRRRCDLSIADRIMSNREFRARATEWAAGRPVQIRVPANADYRCRSKILFKLARYGVTRARYIEE